MARRHLLAPHRRRLAGIALSAALATSPAGAEDAADRAQGERLFRSQCVGCHSLAPGQHIAGPSLHGLIGRPAGGLEGFGYSPVLEAADFEWNADTLDAFLAAPADFLPGSRMVFWGLEERQRQSIIRFLESQAP